MVFCCIILTTFPYIRYCKILEVEGKVHLCGSCLSEGFVFTFRLPWQPSLPVLTAALAAVTFSDFRGKRRWHPWLMNKLCPKAMPSSPSGQRNEQTHWEDVF